jgi:hypothetical protein
MRRVRITKMENEVKTNNRMNTNVEGEQNSNKKKGKE